MKGCRGWPRPTCDAVRRFNIIAYKSTTDPTEHVAAVMGDVDTDEPCW
jgi:GTP cyclohydrolase II